MPRQKGSCLKHYEPFQCEVVPDDHIMMFIHKHQHTWNMILELDKEHDRAFKKFTSKEQRREIRRRLWSKHNPIIFSFLTLVQLEFNYEDSYLYSSVLSRFFRVWHRNKKRIKQ